MVTIDLGYRYWAGLEKVSLLPGQVHVSWGRNPLALNFTNLAFSTYYKARRGANQTTDPTLQKLLIKKLDEAAREGSAIFNWGDLETVFRKLAKDARVQWTDGKTEIYKGAVTTLPVKQTICKIHYVEGPYALVKFMNKMDENMHELGRLGQAYLGQLDNFIQKAGDAKKDWKALGSSLASIKSGADAAAKFMWLAPQKVNLAHGKASSYLDAVNSVQTLANDFLKFRDTGLSTSDAAAISLLKTGLGYLPVLGGFYAGAMGMVPGMKVWFTRLMREYTRKIDARSHVFKTANPTL